MSTATATPLETVTPLVKEWCAAHADRIQACYLKAEPMNRVTLVLADRQEVGFDDAIGRALDEFLDVAWQATGVSVTAWQTGPGSEAELCQVYPVKPADRVFGE